MQVDQLGSGPQELGQGGGEQQISSVTKMTGGAVVNVGSKEEKKHSKADPVEEDVDMD